MKTLLGTPFKLFSAGMMILLQTGGNGVFGAETVGLRDLPTELQYAASESMGRNQKTYHVEAKAGGFCFAAPTQGFTAFFDDQGMTLATGWSQLRLQLVGVGYGERMTVPASSEPTAHDNRVEYRRDGLIEWYVNGPLGLQQGFTLAERPQYRLPFFTDYAFEPLALELELSTGWRAMVSADGRSLNLLGQGVLLRYGDLLALDADGAELNAHFELIGTDIVRLLVDDRGARYPVTIDPFFQQAYLKAGNADFDDNFGLSAAISGDYAVIGALYESGDASSTMENPNDNESRSGAAYIFVRSGSGWTQQAYLKAANAEAFDLFGFSVAISGDYAVVGAPYEAGDASSTMENPNNYESCAGAAYVFVRSGSSWTQQAYLKAANAEAWDFFGWSVAIDGDYVVVGAPYESGNASSTMANPNNEAANAGAAYVFVRSGSSWTQQAYLKALNAEAGDYFGYSMAISGDYAVVGAYEEDGNASSTMSNPNNSASKAGAAYVFVRSGSSWSQQAYLKAFNAEAYDNFGRSVAISGDYAVVGAPYESGDASSTMVNPNNNASGAGAAYVFVRSGSSWTQQAYLKAANAEADDQFGNSVAISGDYAVVGAPYESGDASSTMVNPNNNASGAGAAYVFARSGTSWMQQAYLKAYNAEALDNFGISVAISGDYAVVGAGGEGGDASSTMANPNNEASGAGAAYVFKFGPETQAANVSSSPAGSGSANLSWTRGSGDGCAVFMCAGSTGTAAPVDNVVYTANTAFGSGDQIGTSGWYCVYTGTGTSVTVTNLTPSQIYRVHVCEYKLGSIHYNTNESADNPFNFEAPIAVRLRSFTATVEGSAVRLCWTTVNEAGVAGFNVLRSLESDGYYERINKALIAAVGAEAKGVSYEYVDTVEQTGVHWYKLEIVNLDGSRETGAAISVACAADVGRDPNPTAFALHQNYPNPFNPATTVTFDLPTETVVRLVIYDVQGSAVRTLVSCRMPAGVHHVEWDGRSDSGLAVPSGLYFCRMDAGGFSDIRRMVFLK